MPTPPTAYDETAKGPGLSGLLEIVRRRRVLARGARACAFVAPAIGVAGVAVAADGWEGKQGDRHRPQYEARRMWARGPRHG